MKVFIIGISGATGSRVARLLADEGNTVSGLYRHPEQLAGIQALGASGTLGDVATTSEEELASAITGADVLVFSAGAGEQDDDSMIDAVDRDGVLKTIAALRIAGISRLLLVSVFPEAWRERHMPKSFEHYMAAKKQADVYLVHSELDWVILRPSALTDDPGTGRVSLSEAEIHIDISRDDVAATIATLLHRPEVRRRILEVTAGGTPIASAVATLSN
ncbi:oxidoreductase ylbE [Acidisarcina polymorpha]|uniref:Oxidoreductase ylbE n=1 Tax=Acidisarcina polymorpha TaxID=2211140 RepID=A0A2Z5GB08_9BACT|nr:SDR family oxidoreductase [Acidisarcina polymorpha]AXC15806.1 oxidoreductase ylbE [Acidisarcina polymorpha]